MTLKAAVAEQAPRYAEIKAPVTIISGDARQDGVDQHPFAAVRRRGAERQTDRAAGVGHMVQNAAPDLVIAEIEAMIGRTAANTAAAARITAKTKRGYLVLPSLSYCETNAQRSLISFSFLMPAKAILVPGTLAFGSLMYSLNWASFQVMPEFLLASE